MGQSHSNVPIGGTNWEWCGFEVGSFFVFLKHWNIAKAPFCMKTRLNFKSAIEFIASSENFINDIKIETTIIAD